MIIKEYKVQTYGKTVVCDCGSDLTKNGYDLKDDILYTKFRCPQCGKEEKCQDKDIALRYEVIPDEVVSMRSEEEIRKKLKNLRNTTETSGIHEELHIMSLEAALEWVLGERKELE